MSSSSANPSSTPFRPFLLAALLVLIAGLVAYGNSFAGQYVLDDFRGLLLNESLERLGPDRLWLRATSRPFTEWTFALNIATAGLDRFTLHATNLAIHILTAWLWLGLIWDGLQRWQWQEQTGWRNSMTATVIATLWVVHPITTEGVTYLIQRSESLAACGMLATLLCWNRAVTGLQVRPWWLAAAVLCGFLAAASKPTAVVLPGLILLYHFAVLRQPVRGQSWPIVVGFLALCGASLWILGDAFLAGLLTSPVSTPEVAAESTAGVGAAGLSTFEYLLSQPVVVLYYLFLILTGTSQSLDYGWKVVDAPGVLIPTICAVVGLLVTTAYLLVRAPAVGALAAGFFLLLAPTSSLIPLRDLAVEHRVYLPSACVIALIVIAAGWFVPRRQPHAGDTTRLASGMTRRVIASVLVVTAVGLLIVQTRSRNAEYADLLTFWERAAAVTPGHPRIWTYVVSARMDRGRSAEALEAAQRAVELYEGWTGKPVPSRTEVANAYSLLGTAHAALGRYDQAAVALRKAVELQPHSAVFLTNLGAVLQRSQRLDEAEPLYRDALTYDPLYLSAAINLSRLLRKSKRFAEAIELMQPWGESSPARPEALKELAAALTDVGDLPRADRVYDRLLKLQPRQAEVWLARGKLQRRMGHYESALASFINAGDLMPGDPWPVALQAEMLARAGHTTAAYNLAGQLLSQLSPDSELAGQLKALRQSLKPPQP